MLQVVEVLCAFIPQQVCRGRRQVDSSQAVRGCMITVMSIYWASKKRTPYFGVPDPIEQAFKCPPSF